MRNNGVRRWQAIVSWVIQILLAVLFALQGIMKLGNSPVWIARFRAWGYPEKFYFVIGLIELIGAATLLILGLAPYAALLLMGVMVGAMLTHLLHGEPQFFSALVLFALLSFVVYVRRSRLLSLRRAGPLPPAPR